MYKNILKNYAALIEALKDELEDELKDELEDELENESENESEDDNKTYLNYKDIQYCISTASDLIQEKFDTILCITRGGLIPAGMLAYELGIKNIVTINASSYNDDNSQEEFVSIEKLSKKDIKKLNASNHILIVDDIIDSGNTIKAIKKYLFEKINVNVKYSVFSIVSKKIELNNYYIYNMTGNDNWVVFPWDK